MATVLMVFGAYALLAGGYLTLASWASKRRHERKLALRASGAAVVQPSWALVPDQKPLRPVIDVAPKLPRSRSAEQLSGGYRTAAV